MTDFAPVGPSTYSPYLWCPLLEDHETTCFQTLQTSKSYAESHVTSASHPDDVSGACFRTLFELSSHLVSVPHCHDNRDSARCN